MALVVVVAEAVPRSLRGALSRWLVEVGPGIFVGHMSARVRDELWSLATEAVVDGRCTLVHPSTNEQGYVIRTAGKGRYEPIDLDGLTLIGLPATGNETVTAQ